MKPGFSYHLILTGFGIMFFVSQAMCDTIYFQSGVVYERNLEINASGSEDNPLVITTTGQEKAIISSGNGFGLRLSNCDHVKVSNLVIRGNGRLSGSKENGVIIENCRNLVLEDLEVKGFQHSGVLVRGSSQKIRICHIYANENGFAGIQVIGKYPDRYACKNITIDHCRVENNPGDPTVLNNHSGNGIIVGACDSVLIEYCEALGNGWDMPRIGNGPVGIWAWHADHVIIQHCISHQNRTSQGGADGGGFDLDGGVTNSVIQYCLSYENEGAGFGVFEYANASPLHHNTIRYNISINDGIKNGNTSVMVWNGTHDSTKLRQVCIYNNLFYSDRRGGSAVYFTDAYQKEILFANNIFLTCDPALKGPLSNSCFIGNVYWNLGYPFSLGGYTSFDDWVKATGKEMLGGVVQGMNLDPLLLDPGPLYVTYPDSLDLVSLAGFTLQQSSPVIDKGIGLLLLKGIDPGSSDFFGHPIPSGTGYDPGIHEYQDTNLVSVDLDDAKDEILVLQADPDNGMIHLKLGSQQSDGSIRIRITDLQGRVIQTDELPVAGGLVTFRPAPQLGHGLFLISVEQGSIVKSTKILF